LADGTHGQDAHATASGGRTKYAAYKYLGASTVAEADHPAVPNGLKLSYAGSTSGDYSGFDRFGRVVWQRWLRTDGATAADRYFYGYDRSGNRKWRAERSNAAYGDGKRDEAYVYDKLDRLVGAKRGILPSGAYLAPYPGDVNLDSTVNFDDYIIMATNWTQSGKTSENLGTPYRLNSSRAALRPRWMAPPLRPGVAGGSLGGPLENGAA